MTSEVLVMNQIGIALAADSASTVMNKTFKADKLFELSRTQPIGLMVYGLGAIDNVPLEVIVSEFRRHTGDKEFDTVEECARSFLAFVEKGGTDSHATNPIITPPYVDQFTENSLDHVLWRLAHRIDGNRSGSSATNDLLSDLVKEASSSVRSEEVKEFSRAVSESLKRTGGYEKLKRYPMWSDRKLRNKVLMLYAGAVLSKNGFGLATGVVIAGYGKREYLPSYVEYRIHGLFHNGLCYTLNSEAHVDQSLCSKIGTFAQDDVMQTFITGIDPDLLEEINIGMLQIIDDITGLISQYLPEKVDIAAIHGVNEQIVSRLMDSIQRTMKLRYARPVELAVQFLSKDEMAMLAESLIQSTSLRRHVSQDKETVGGPIDVALITRNEGFIWIRRKHYFDKEQNPSYLRRRQL